MTDQYERQRMRVNNAPDLHFEGAVIGEYTTQNRDASKPSWTEIRLWQTRGGAWIVETVGCSTRPGQVDICDALVIEAPIEHEDANRPEAISEVMQFLGWTVVAKAFAKQMGWSVARRID